MRKLFVIAILAIGITMTGCTANNMARNYGGESTQTLPPGKKLVNITWKDSDMWILTRDRRADEKIETYTFSESSNFGVMNGTVTIKEQ